MSKTNEKNAQLMIETIIEETEKNIIGVISSLMHYSSLNKHEKWSKEITTEMQNMLWAILIHDIHNLLVLQIVGKDGKKPTQEEYEALFKTAEEEAARRMLEFTIKLRQQET